MHIALPTPGPGPAASEAYGTFDAPSATATARGQAGSANDLAAPSILLTLDPVAPFWLTFAGFYLAGPVADWAIFGRLWRLRPWLAAAGDAG